LIGTFGGTKTYRYQFVLPVPFQAAAGTKYWVQIYAAQQGRPDWGFSAGTGGDGNHYQRNHETGDIYRSFPGDAAFTLLGPASPISGLSASNDSPTVLGQMTSLTATITSGSGVSYAWTFGDGTSGSGRVATHFYPHAGVFTATVTATNGLGQASATTTVRITAPFQILLPVARKR
jgi:PKD repeat protein